MTAATTRRAGQPRVLLVAGGMIVIGGLERMMLEAAAVVAARGGRVHCIVSSWGGREMIAAATRLGFSWSAGSFRYPLTRRPSLLQAAAIVAEGAYDSVNLLWRAARFRPTHVLLPELQMALRTWPALALLRAAGVRVVLALQNAPAVSPFYRRVWRRLIHPVVDELVCSSRACEQPLLDFGLPGRKVRVVHNTAAAPPAPPAEQRDLKRIMFVGQIIPAKGLDLLLEAVAMLVARGRDVTLDVVGDVDGWLRPEYRGFREAQRERARQPDLDGRVRFLGWRDDVPALLAGAGVHCSPSRPEMHEGMPLVVIEAKNAGIPSVAFAHGPFVELIEHGRTGELAAPETPEALAGALDALVGAPDRLVAMTEPVKSSAARFSRDVFAAGWWHVFSASGSAVVEAAERPEPGNVELGT